MRAFLLNCVIFLAITYALFGLVLPKLLSPSIWTLVGAVYFAGVTWLIATATQSALDKLLCVQEPLSVSTIEAYISMARDIGLLRRLRVKKEQDEDKSDAVQCEAELLLSDLHAILISSWFDIISPKDAEFPRASRMAFSRAAHKVETCVRRVSSFEAAQAALILAIGHARRIKGGPWPKTEEEVALKSSVEALLMRMLPSELCQTPTGPLLSALLSHGAFSRALSLVADPGWLQMQIAWTLGVRTDELVERPATLTLSKVPELKVSCDGDDEEEVEDEAEATPEYEEASDLASSIAKLRTLLAAKDDQAEKASELPNDDRPFMHLAIVGNEVVDKGSGPPYVLYCIQYEVVVMADGGPRLAVMQIRRRFQEFLNLQSRLEEQPHFKAALRGVKGPSKWLALAFSKAGQQTTAQRQPVLERYLQQLCEQPAIARSEALQTFLAFGSSTAMAYTRGSSERLDRLLARTVSDVFHTIKTALPTFEDQMVEQTEYNEHFDLKYSFMEGPPQNKELNRDIKRFVSNCVVEAASEAFADKPDHLRTPLISPMSPTTVDAAPLPQHSLVSLAEVLMQELAPSCWLWQSPFLSKGRLLLSHWLEHRLQTLANTLWSTHSALIVLRLCRLALAPGPPLVRPTREQGHRALASALQLPTWLSLVAGGGAACEGRDLVLRAFACETSNRQLGLDLALSATYLLTK